MITFFSNFINEHQIPFCEAMYKRCNGEFRFVATEEFSQERIKLGFEDKSDRFPFIVRSYENEESFQKAMELGKNSDVVIIGSAPDVFIEERLKKNKLTFRYCERFFKRGKWRILDPRVLYWYYKLHFRYRKKNLHMLCASAYTAPDCRFISSYPKKTYMWGYFPPVSSYEHIENILDAKKKNSILWVARLIKLKHPEYPLEVARRLKEAGYNFQLTMIGVGPFQDKVNAFIEKYALQENVRVVGAMSPEEVREYMRENEIFLFTSDKNEGWGAVLNESMNDGCAVVANRAIGSAPYLIKDGENGLTYKNDVNDLYEKVKLLMDNPDLRKKLGKNAYETLATTWNGDEGAKRLLQLIEDIQNGKQSRFESGPCSKDYK